MYFYQIEREAVRAIDVIDELRKLVVRNRLLVVLEYFPLRFVPEDADVRCRMQSQRKERQKKRQMTKAISLRRVKSLDL